MELESIRTFHFGIEGEQFAFWPRKRKKKKKAKNGGKVGDSTVRIKRATLPPPPPPCGQRETFAVIYDGRDFLRFQNGTLY